MAKQAVAWREQVRELRRAAEVITNAARTGTPINGADGEPVATLSRAFARPLALDLRAAAELIEAHRHALGLPVNYALEMAGLVQGRDLGHDR